MKRQEPNLRGSRFQAPGGPFAQEGWRPTSPHSRGLRVDHRHPLCDASLWQSHSVV